MTAELLPLPAMRQLSTDEEIGRYLELVEAAKSRMQNRESDRYIRVVTGTGNAKERKELDALCRGLRGE